jgi:TolA-binding protein
MGKNYRSAFILLCVLAVSIYSAVHFNIWYYHKNLNPDQEIETFQQETADVLITLTKKIIRNEAKISDLQHQLKMQDKVIEQMMMDEIRKEGINK